MERLAVREGRLNGWAGWGSLGVGVVVDSQGAQDKDSAEGSAEGRAEGRENSENDREESSSGSESDDDDEEEESSSSSESEEEDEDDEPAVENVDDMETEPVAAPRIAYSLTTFHIPASGRSVDGCDHAAMLSADVLPKVAEFVELLQRLRRQDSLRLLWLAGDDEERRAIVSGQLSYL